MLKTKSFFSDLFPHQQASQTVKQAIYDSLDISSLTDNSCGIGIDQVMKFTAQGCTINMDGFNANQDSIMDGKCVANQLQDTKVTSMLSSTMENKMKQEAEALTLSNVESNQVTELTRNLSTKLTDQVKNSCIADSVQDISFACSQGGTINLKNSTLTQTAHAMQDCLFSKISHTEEYKQLEDKLQSILDTKTVGVFSTLQKIAGDIADTFQTAIKSWFGFLIVVVIVGVIGFWIFTKFLTDNPEVTSALVDIGTKAAARAL